MRFNFGELRYRYHILPSSTGALVNTAKSRIGSTVILCFCIVYLLAILYFRSRSYRDPTSVFFDPDGGYAPLYSTVRQRQANAFIESANTKPPFPVNDGDGGSRSANKSLCLGIASVARTNARYFPTAVGSLLEGLDDQERANIYLILFIAHTDPTIHPAYSEGWFRNVADKVLAYDLPEDQMDHLRQLENEGGLYREKALFDYVHLLKACSAIGSPYIAMLEDDVLALDGWYHRTREALDRAEVQSAIRKASPNFLYLRLFYTEEFLGWNSEEWPTYFVWSVVLVAVPAAGLLAFRRSSLGSKYQHLLSNPAILTICGVFIPLCIMLFFAAGRVTMLPLPAGVNEMNRFGCCSQGFVFPYGKAQDLIGWYESKKVGFVDMLTEEYGDKFGETRWALTPSVLQHVGRKSSKGDDFGKAAKHGRTVAEKLWNFAFELNDAEKLRKEHSKYRHSPFTQYPPSS